LFTLWGNPGGDSEEGELSGAALSREPRRGTRPREHGRLLVPQRARHRLDRPDGAGARRARRGGAARPAAGKRAARGARAIGTRWDLHLWALTRHRGQRQGPCY